MTAPRTELFDLLPLVYQQRDAEPGQGGALEALLRVLGEQHDVVAADLGRLYDDLFIETCAEWVVPYLGDLLGVRLLHPVGPGAGRSRALVADTLDHRRRKGTLAGLENLAFQVTGWPTSAVEYFQRLGVTQHLAHAQPGNLRTPDLRRASEPEILGGPFGRSAHTAEARRLPAGRYGIGNIGLHVWRLRPQRVIRATARPVSDPPDGRYHVDPIGREVPLFNPGTAESAITSLAKEHHVPAPLRRRALFDELEGMRDGSVTLPRWFGDDPVIELFANTGGGLAPVPLDQVTAANLADAPVPPATGWPRPGAPLTVAVDPVLGRVAFRDGLLPTAVEVTATYAAPGEVGAGPYDRTCVETTDLVARQTWFRAVGQGGVPVPGVVQQTLTEAIADWNAEPAGTVGVIALLDSRSYVEDVAVTVPAGSELLVVATAWPDAEDAAAPTVVLDLAGAKPDDRRPHLLGSIEVTGTTGAADAAPGELTVDGILVEGEVTVAPGDLGRLALRHATVVPGLGGVSVAEPTTASDDNGRLTVEVNGCIVGPVLLPARGPELDVSRSIVDGHGAAAVDAGASRVWLDRATVLGAVSAEELSASDCVLDGQVSVTRRQSGCMRFSYLSEGAAAPRRHRCQPDLALTDVTDPTQAAAIRARLTPVFSSTTYGDPAYGRLDDRGDEALLTGASNGAAMGAFADLQEPQRMVNLAAVLEEYLRLGLEAGVMRET
jgi:hypothetical protein